MAILDQYGRLIPSSTPVTDEIATAAKDIDIFTGWLGRMENPDPVLRTEAGGKGLKLYDEVARDAHASSVLQTRYLSVVGKEWQVEPASDDARDQEIADFVERVLLGCNFDQGRQELLRGILYGFYVGEIIWKASQVEGKPAIVIERIRAKHPRRFLFTMERELRLLTPSNQVEGEPVPERKFAVFSYGSSDNPYGEALGQKLWWPVWFKKNGVKFWLVFLEKFGSPTVVGKYPPGTPADKQQALLDALDAIQQETGIKIPDNMAIEFLEATRGGKVEYETICDYMDKQISKAVLGQTATTEGTPGKLGSEDAQENVRDDIVKADADVLCECLNNSVVPWLVDYNFSGVSAYPKLWIRTEPEADLKALAERDKTLVKDIGLPVGKKYFYDTYGIPEPEEGEDTVGERPLFRAQRSSERSGLPSAAVVPPSFAEGDEEDSIESLMAAQAEVDRIADERTQEGAAIFKGYLAQIKGFLSGVPSLDAARDTIAHLYKTLDAAPLAESLAEALLQADRIGTESVPGNSEFGIRNSEFAEWGPGLPFEEAIDFFKAKGFTIAGVAKADLLADVKDEITKSMATGGTIEEFRKAADSLFQKHGYDPLAPHRIDTIYRTNMQSAYQAGRYRQMTTPAVLAVRPYWRYVAVMDTATRPEHAAMNGRIFRNDNPVWQTWYPPNGFNCRCAVQTLSEREIRKRGWTVEDEDLTGKSVEWIDPNTGEVMQVVLSPDGGFAGRPARLEKLLKDKKAELEQVAWKEKPDQPGPAGFGRPLEKSIAPQMWKPSPGKTESLEALVKLRGMSESEAISTVESEYKRVMGISPNETMGVLEGPDGEVMKVDLNSLAHAMLDRKSGRERYLRYFRQAIEDPYEILLTEYSAGKTAKTKLRKKYVGLFLDEKQEGVVVVAETTGEGWTMWNVMNAKKGTVDRQRHGVELLFGQ